MRGGIAVTVRKKIVISIEQDTALPPALSSIAKKPTSARGTRLVLCKAQYHKSSTQLTFDTWWRSLRLTVIWAGEAAEEGMRFQRAGEAAQVGLRFERQGRLRCEVAPRLRRGVS